MMNYFWTNLIFLLSFAIWIQIYIYKQNGILMQIYNCWIIKLSDVNLIKNIIKDKYRLEMTTASSHLSK